MQKRKAKWLSIFLECWYNSEELKRITQEHIKNLSENKIPYDKAILISKALSQSRYTSTSQRDKIINIVDNLSKTNKDCLIQLPKKYEDIRNEIETLYNSNQIDKAIQIANEIENEEDGIKFNLLGRLYDEKLNSKEAEKHFLLAIGKSNIKALGNLAPVSYTHLTLPTKRIV